MSDSKKQRDGAERPGLGHPATQRARDYQSLYGVTRSIPSQLAIQTSSTSSIEAINRIHKVALI